jgi:hypothetical protein
VKSIIIISLFFYLTGCSEQKTSYFIPKEYWYPDDSIGAGKTFVYRNGLSNQEYYVNLTLSNIDGRKFKSFLSYNSKFKIDSNVFHNGELVGTYYQLSTSAPQMYKGDIIENKIINNDNKLGKQITCRICQTNELTQRVSSESTYLKDTTVIWEENYLPCIVLLQHKKLEVKSSIYQSYIRNFDYCDYFAKGLGLIKYTVAFKDNKGIEQNAIYNLTSIHDISKNRSN